NALVWKGPEAAGTPSLLKFHLRSLPIILRARLSEIQHFFPLPIRRIEAPKITKNSPCVNHYLSTYFNSLVYNGVAAEIRVKIVVDARGVFCYFRCLNASD